MKYDEKTGDYRCQIDKQWFDLSADLLRKALAITPVIPAQPFELPSSELLWEEFTQGIQTFFSHKVSHKASLKDPKKKVTPLLIPYGRFSKFVPKGEFIEVFGNGNSRSPCLLKPFNYPRIFPNDVSSTKKCSSEEGNDPDLETGLKKMSLEAHQNWEKEKGDVADMNELLS
ncbi:hypothetical protein Tco_0053577 [Tanacetum coccineum]